MWNTNVKPSNKRVKIVSLTLHRTMCRCIYIWIQFRNCDTPLLAVVRQKCHLIFVPCYRKKMALISNLNANIFEFTICATLLRGRFPGWTSTLPHDTFHVSTCIVAGQRLSPLFRWAQYCTIKCFDAFALGIGQMLTLTFCSMLRVPPIYFQTHLNYTNQTDIRLIRRDSLWNCLDTESLPDGNSVWKCDLWWQHDLK